MKCGSGRGSLEDEEDPSDIMNKGLIEGMNIVGELFKDGELFVPEVLMSANAMDAGMELIKPHLSQTDVKKAGKVLSGSKELTEQTRYNVQLMYIQNEKLAGMDNAVGTTCPNCGAPITNLGAAYCEYCGSAVTLLNLKVWTLHSFDETDYHHS